MKNYSHIFLLLFSLLSGCLGLEKSESKKLKRENLTFKLIKNRKKEAHTLMIPPPKLLSLSKNRYPWDHKYIHNHPRITKEYFRCKGNLLNPFLRIESTSHQVTYQIDCGGIHSHSLPIREGKEFIYPILINLLNFVQEKSKHRVIITSGHRCPIHNSYIDPSKKNRLSKHLMGAIVDFYVEKMEQNPLAIVAILKSYYDHTPFFLPFRETANKWKNKEITITLHESDQDRNKDNDHPYPYLSIEVNYHREIKRFVPFSWQKAYQNFYRNS